MSEGGFEPPPLSGPEPKSGASASSATRPHISSRVALTALFFPRCSFRDVLFAMVFDPPVDLFAAALAARRVRRSSPRNYSRWP